jgi:DNA-binding PadR family transcriptional regulator
MDAKTLCLGVLARGDASGYEIKKAFEEGPFAHIHPTSFGSIYPALAKLTEEGLVSCTELAQDKRPDKKVYAMTEAGRAALVAELMEPPAPDRARSDLLFILFLAHLLPRDRVAKLIDQRIAWYEQSLERMTCCGIEDRPPGVRFVHGLGLAVYGAAADYLRAHGDELLDQLASPTEQAAE